MAFGLYVVPPLFVVVATVIEVGVLIWGLRQTAREGKRYLGQVGAGTLMALIGGIIIIVTSLLYNSVFFPEVLSEIAHAAAEEMRAAGTSEAEIEHQMARQTSLIMNAITGFAGCMVIGNGGSFIIAAFIRTKEAPPQA